MSKIKVLIIEDEKDILELLKYNFSKEGYQVTTASTGEDGYRLVRKYIPDIIILDLMLPGIDGFEVCKLIKKDSKTEHIPIIMLTAKSEEADIVTGLEVGADDYVTKPFSPKILIARVRSILRRKSQLDFTRKETIRINNLIIAPGRYEVSVDNRPITLTLTEFQLLYTLAKHPGWVFTRNQLIDEIRGEDSFITDRSIDVQIVGLRKKLGKVGKYIQTVRGVGYRFKE